ncbi:MAG: PAS domain-containing protein, partial [Oscillospiraceae bacterium]|nr:PAS domain-containing protein [Oscillospiraceae bacterium]
ILYLSLENITERKELDSLRSRLDGIVYNVPAGIALFEYRDSKAYPVFISDKGCELFGYTREEYEARMREGLPVSFMPSGMGELESIPESGMSESVEHIVRARRKDGSWFWLRIVYNAVAHEGQYPLVYTTLFDVTEQREAEDEMSVLMQSMTSGVLKHSEDFATIDFASDSLLKMLGCSREDFDEFYEGDLTRLYYFEDFERAREEIRHQIRDVGQEGAVEVRLVTRCGHLLWVNAVGHLVEDFEGSRWYYVIITDIENRKRLENELLDKSRQTEAVIQNVPGGVEMYEIRDGVAVRKFISEGMASIYGCPKEELDSFLGTDVFSRNHPDDLEMMKRAVDAVIREPSLFNQRYRSRRNDGSYIWVHQTGNPVAGTDGILRYYCVYTDITEQMEADERLRLEKQKLDFVINDVSILVWEYDIAKKTYSVLNTSGRYDYLPMTMENAPECIIEKGLVSPRSAGEIRRIYREIDEGAPYASCEALLLSNDGEYSWKRVSLRTVFVEGKAVNAIGTGVDISKEIEALTRRQDLEMALNASSLYFWSFDPQTGTYPIVNKNAARLGIGRVENGRQLGLREIGVLAEDDRLKTSSYMDEVRRDPQIAQDGRSVLHMNKEVCGMEWMQVSCAVVRDSDGEIRSISFAGEDYTRLYQNEQLYTEVLLNLQEGEAGESIVSLVADLSADLVEAYRGTFGRSGMPYSQLVSEFGERVYAEDDRAMLTEKLSPASLMDAFRRGETALSFDYLRVIRDEKLPRWVRTSARTFYTGGHIKALIASMDIDKEAMNREISLTVCRNNFELIYVVHLDTDFLRVYRKSELEDGLVIGEECPYDENLRRFIMRYVRLDSQKQALETMSLENLRAQFAAGGPLPGMVFPVEVDGRVYYKKWELCRMDIDERAVIITRTDVTDAELLRRYSDQMRLALADSRVVVCRYDVASKTLSMPEDYASLTNAGSPAQKVSERAYLTVAPGDRERYLDFYKSIDSGVPKGDVTIQFIYEDGSLHWCRAGFISEFDDSGKPLGAVVTVSEVTRQRQQEIELERNRLLLEHNGIALFDYDTKTDTVIFEAVRKDEGLVRIVRENYYEYVLNSVIVQNDSVNTLRETIRAAREKPMTGSVEYAADNWGTGYRWCRLLYTSVADESGSVYRIVGQINDIQEEKDREALVADLQRNIHSRERAGEHDSMVLVSALQYLSEARDADVAIRHLLGLLGERYHADMAHIYEFSGPDEFERSYVWRAADSPIPPPYKQPVKASGIKLYFENSRLLVCGSEEEFPEDLREHLSARGIRSMLLCAMLHNGELIGCLGFYSEREGAFSELNTGTLTLLCDVIALNILKQRGEEAAELSADFLKMLDNSTFFAYLIDPETHRVLYKNKALLDKFPDGPEELPCYGELAGRQAPCNDCPMSALNADGSFKAVQVNWRNKLWIVAQASPIRWQGQEAFMVICADITAQKAAEYEIQARNGEYAAIVKQSGKRILRYNASTGVGETFNDAEMDFSTSRTIPDFVEEMIRRKKVAPESAGDYREFFSRIRAGEPSGSGEFLINGSNGRQRWDRADYSLICDAEGRPSYAIVSYFDNTEAHNKEAAYRQWRQGLTRLFSDKAIYLEVNLTRDRIEHEENMTVENEGRKGDRLTDFVEYGRRVITYKEDVPVFLEFFDRKRLLGLFEAGCTQDNLRYRAIIEGRPQWFRAEIEMAKAPDTGDVMAYIAYTNVDSEMREQKRMEDMASTDAMTGLLNRAALESRVAKALHEAVPDEQTALFMFDIDDFKAINDTMGHQLGDDTLVQVAAVIRRAFRGSDLVCRFGGDEYMAFMCGGVGEEVVHAKARALLDLLRLAVGEITTSVSIGVCLAKAGETSFEQLYSIADRALYTAKRSGKNTYCILEADVRRQV